MRKFSTGAQGVRFFEYSARVSAFLLSSICVGATGRAQTTDQIPPTPPTGLVASAANCGQVDLSWSASTDTGGSGLYTYTIYRSDGVNSTLGATRAWFDDTNFVKSSTTLTYYVVATDAAGNQSVQSNLATVVTPPCSVSLGEQVISEPSVNSFDAKEPLGKAIATWGSRTAYLYLKWTTTSTLDTWLYIKDSDTGQTSSFLLHKYPGYYIAETDYVFTSATELFTVARDSGAGKVLVSQYTLNGSPIPTSATLVSTQLFGDSHSTPRSMIRLQSGALMMAWNEADSNYFLTDFVAGFAYRSPTGNWAFQFPVTVTNPFGGNSTMTQMAMAQHPTDGSIWAFAKRDAFHQIIALHFTESGGNITLDWTKPDYIAQSTSSPVPNNDGINGPETEFPFLSAIADSTRSAILLAYQRNEYQILFTDYASGSGALKEATAAIAQIASDGSKTFIGFPTYMERQQQFGFSVLADGTLWLAYHPINHQTFTWNEVYASKYQNGVWSTPAHVGFNYNYYNSIGPYRNPGLLAYRTDQPEAAFRTPDQKIHTIDLSNLGPAPADTTAPTTSITSPVGGATVSGTVSVSASASDNAGVTSVQLLVDGTAAGTATSAPYNFSWNTTTAANGSHTLQTQAFDAAGNTGLSGPVAVSVGNLAASSLAVAVTNPTNGSSVPRNQKVTVSASVTDNAKVTRVEFYVDNVLLSATTTAPYNYPWKVPAKPGASHKVQARAYDALGNTAAQAITVIAQ
jgi:Bacterial Ig domain